MNSATSATYFFVTLIICICCDFSTTSTNRCCHRRQSPISTGAWMKTSRQFCSHCDESPFKKAFHSKTMSKPPWNRDKSFIYFAIVHENIGVLHGFTMEHLRGSFELTWHGCLVGPIQIADVRAIWQLQPTQKNSTVSETNWLNYEKRNGWDSYHLFSSLSISSWFLAMMPFNNWTPQLDLTIHGFPIFFTTGSEPLLATELNMVLFIPSNLA